MTKPLDLGLYEALITRSLEEALLDLPEDLVDRSELASAEVANRISLHMQRVVERALRSIESGKRTRSSLEVAAALIQRLDELIEGVEAVLDTPVARETVLRAIFRRLPDGSPDRVEQPLTPLLDTTLLTNSPGEPRVGRQLSSEIASADGLDLLMAFIRMTGIRPFLEPLRRHCDDGRPLRVLTTTYTGSTEQRALDRLRELGAEIKVSYDTTTTRLHAKAWLFHRASGFSTAFVGSSNLTHSAQTAGLEWNVRISGARNPDVVEKVGAVFDSYWESDGFVAYEPTDFEERTKSRHEGPQIFLSPVEVRPYLFQEKLLEQLAVSRQQGHHRNLLAAATGTGKTVVAALDYARLRSDLARSRLLFVAHRREILDQSQATFRHVLRDPAFGEQWHSGEKPSQFEHVFASIQSLNVADLEHLDRTHFDVVIVDEFHHAAAPSYRRLLKHVQPEELVGLTATPERADQLPVLHWFGDRIAAELRLWDAIDQQHLVPFHYYGVHDGLDLSEVPWRRGRGYDTEELTNIYTASDVWARRVIHQVLDKSDGVDELQALGFCASVEHARFMANVFTEQGIGAVAVWADTPAAERAKALKDLGGGRVKVVFSVDLFNEGVDVPSVNTLLLLRPTDSPVLFLQQLGRGLRRSGPKPMCTVLDFVGHHRKEFRFDRRLRALLGGTRREIERQVKAGFPYLPAGCHLELDPVASKIVLESIKNSVPSNWAQKAEELRSLVASGGDARLKTYLDEAGVELEDVYSNSRSWSDLKEAAGLPVKSSGPSEPALRRAVGRLLHVDDQFRLSSYARLVAADLPPRVESLSETDRRLARMLVSQLVDQAVHKSTTLQQGLDLVWEHHQIRDELCELLPLLSEATDHLHRELPGRPSVPLRLHGRYTRLEILAAFGVGEGAKVAAWQTGVRWVPESAVDLFAFTLDKTDGDFSPTTRYSDYAISRELIHWESQSVTRADSETGLRYQQHAAKGTDVMLFARLRQSERAFWFLGPATYVRHSGERPMAIVWKLQHPLPADLFSSFAAAIA